ncbi:MAG: hypothetical protein ACMG6S_33710 [Byssovorax sp.]
MLLGALLASGCSAILGADRGYYEVSTEGAGGGGGTSTGTSTSTVTNTGEMTSMGTSGGGGSSTSSGTSSSSSSGTGGAINDTCWHGEPADPGGTDPCGAGSVGVLADDFNDNLVGPLWGIYEIGGTAMEANHQAVVSIPGAPAKFAGFVSTIAYSLVGCHGSIEVVKAPQHPSTVAHLSFSPDPSSGVDRVEVHQIDKSLVFTLVAGGAATDNCVIPYLPTAHRFWRVRETGGNLLWETAPDGLTWTVQRREKTPAFASTVRVDFGVIPLAADLPGVGVFDNFDMP